MPFLAPVIAWVGATFAVSAEFATMIVASVIMTGVNFAIKGITGLFANKGSVSNLLNDSANHSVTARQPAAPGRVVYGEDRIGGIYTELATSGTSNEFLHAVITFTKHEIDSYTGFFFENEALTFSAGAATGKYAGFVWIETKLGAAGEAAFPNLVSDLPAYWTSNHRQDGCASVHLKLKYDATLFPSGLPNLRVGIRGKKVFDPRTGLTAWSDNAALCARDYLADGVIGYGAKLAELDDALAIAAANICDELVSIHGGATEKRYTCNGTFDLSETPQDVLTDIIAAMSGRCVWSGGQWRLYAGAYRAPALAYGDDDLRDGSIMVTARRSRRDRCNGVKGTFIDPLNEYQPNDFPAYTRSAARGYAQDDFLINDAGIANFRGAWALGLGAIAQLDGVSVTVGSAVTYYVCDVAHAAAADKQPGVGANWPSYWTAAERIWMDIELRFTKSASMAQRLAKIELETNRREIAAVMPYKLDAYQSVPPDVAMFSHARFGWANKTFEITELQLAFDTGGGGSSAPLLGVSLSIAETDPNVYSWSAADDLAQVTAAALPLPPGPTSSVGGLGGSGGGTGVINLSWTAPATQDGLDGNTYVYYKLHTASTYGFWSQLPGTQTSESVTGLASGLSYDFEVYNVDSLGRRGANITSTQTAP